MRGNVRDTVLEVNRVAVIVEDVQEAALATIIDVLGRDHAVEEDVTVRPDRVDLVQEIGIAIDMAKIRNVDIVHIPDLDLQVNHDHIDINRVNTKNHQNDGPVVDIVDHILGNVI